MWWRTPLSFVSTQSPRICHRSSLPTACIVSSPQWSWILLVSHSTSWHIRIWMELVSRVCMSNPMNEINQSKLNQCRTYSAAMETITCSRNSITCSSIRPKTTASMSSCVRQWMAFLNIHGQHILDVLWKSIMPHCLNIHTHPLNHSIINVNSNYLLLYIIITSIPCYNENDDLFKHCNSIESVVDKEYKVNVSMDGVCLLDMPFIDILNNLVTLSHTKLINGIEWTSESHTIFAFTNIPSLVCLGGVKSITIVFEHLGEVVSTSSSECS